MTSPAIAITIKDLESERTFTDYFKRRAELRDCLRYGVYPNLRKFLDMYNAFLVDYAPGGTYFDKEIWAYYSEQIKPIGEYQAGMIAAAQGIVDTMLAIEAAAPGTFGIELPVAVEQPIEQPVEVIK